MIYIIFTLVVTLTTVQSKMTCTKCPFRIEPKGPTKCTESCEGDVCYIVVNQYYNGTKIAGCIDLHEGDKLQEPAVCYKQSHQTTCACTTKDHCNSPTSPIADFKFQETPFLEGYQFQPLVGGGERASGDQVTHTLKPVDEIGNTPGVKPGNEHYAPTPNGVPLDAVVPSATMAMTAMPVEEVLTMATTNTSGNGTVVTWTVSVPVEDNDVPQPEPTTMPSTTTLTESVVSTKESTPASTAKTETPGGHSKSALLQYPVATAIFTMSTLLFVMF